MLLLLLLLLLWLRLQLRLRLQWLRRLGYGRWRIKDWADLGIQHRVCVADEVVDKQRFHEAVVEPLELDDVA